MKIPKDGQTVIIIVLLLAVLILSLQLISVKRATHRERDLERELESAQLEIASFDQRTEELRVGLIKAEEYIDEKKWGTWAAEMPEEFPSVGAFKDWVDQQNLAAADMGSWETARQLQRQAFQDGHLIQYQLVTNIISGETEWWVVAPVGDEIWLITPVEPTGDGGLRFYPSDLWEYKKIAIVKEGAE